MLSDNAFKDKFKLIKGNKAHKGDNLSAGEMKLVVTKEFSPCVSNLLGNVMQRDLSLAMENRFG